MSTIGKRPTVFRGVLAGIECLGSWRGGWRAGQILEKCNDEGIRPGEAIFLFGRKDYEEALDHIEILERENELLDDVIESAAAPPPPRKRDVSFTPPILERRPLAALANRLTPGGKVDWMDDDVRVFNVCSSAYSASLSATSEASLARRQELFHQQMRRAYG